MFAWLRWDIERTEDGEQVVPGPYTEPTLDDVLYVKAGCKGGPCPQCSEPTNPHLRAGGVQLCPFCFYSWSV